MINHQPPFIVCAVSAGLQNELVFSVLHSLWPHSLNENFQKLITGKPSSSHCHYKGRGDGPADSLGSCREQGSDTLSHSPALIVQKMWFVPQPHFLGKVVFTVRGVPVAWIALLFSHPGTLSCMCAYVSLYANFFVSECESFHIFCLSFLSTQHFTMWLPFTHQRNIFKKK